MNFIDWILAGLFILLISFAFYLLVPEYSFGWLVGAALAVLLIYRAKKRRDKLRAEVSEYKNSSENEKN